MPLRDTDHGASHSQRVTMMDQDRDTDMGRGRRRQHHLSSMDNSSSHNTSTSEQYAHGFDTYMAPDPSQMVQDVQ
jgi:hypothetical protein